MATARSAVVTLIAFVVAIIGLATPSWPREGRVALVVGNGAYQSAPPLPNPANDAEDVGALLKSLGFDVIVVTDADLHRFGAAVSEFLARAATAEAALFYYSGHGVQDGTENYLLPVDARIENAFSLCTETLALGDILAELDAVSDVNLVFLDACRDNPFSERVRQVLATRGIATIGRGLARVTPRGANTMIAFAAAPGEVALDGEGRNSPFTAAFLKNVATSSDDVSTLFKAIIRDVRKETNGKQQPQMMSAMSESFFFNKAAVQDGSRGQDTEAREAYAAAERIGTAEAFQTIVNGFPGTVEASLAKAAIDKLRGTVAAVSPATSQQPPERKLSGVFVDPEVAEQNLGLSTEQYAGYQTALADLGYEVGASDGSFGQQSRTALRAFQRAFGVEESGYIDGRTRAKLDAIIGETPPGYQGLWSLEIHRYNYNPTDPDSINGRTHLASAEVRVRGDQIFIVKSASLSTEHNEFETFKGTLDGGAISPFQ